MSREEGSARPVDETSAHLAGRTKRLPEGSMLGANSSSEERRRGRTAEGPPLPFSAVGRAGAAGERLLLVALGRERAPEAAAEAQARPVGQVGPIRRPGGRRCELRRGRHGGRGRLGWPSRGLDRPARGRSRRRRQRRRRRRAGASLVDREQPLNLALVALGKGHGSRRLWSGVKVVVRSKGKEGGAHEGQVGVRKRHLFRREQQRPCLLRRSDGPTADESVCLSASASAQAASHARPKGQQRSPWISKGSK